MVAIPFHEVGDTCGNVPAQQLDKMVGVVSDVPASWRRYFATMNQKVGIAKDPPPPPPSWDKVPTFS